MQMHTIKTHLSKNRLKQAHSCLLQDAFMAAVAIKRLKCMVQAHFTPESPPFLGLLSPLLALAL
jgi:hypothetical protein